ncbi:MAG TPA: TolC family protein [Bryobacteraceae bacterium]|nr:TolC family protein [Bryobacteraceae bacterium]
MSNYPARGARHSRGMAFCLLTGLSWVPSLPAQSFPDYTVGTRPFPNVFRPYETRQVPRSNLSGIGSHLTVEDGKLRLSMEQLVEAVVENNLNIAAARYYPPMAQTDLLRARSGSSPRGVDASVIPSSVFAGAEGGSILGTAAGGTGGGGTLSAGGITGTASQVVVRPSGVFDPSLTMAFSLDRTASPLNTLIVAGVPSVTTNTAALSVNYVQAFTSGTSFTLSYSMQRQGSTQLRLLYDPFFAPGFTTTVSQQLLNGFGFKVNRALIKVAENEQHIERESFRQQVIIALTSAKNAYWDLVAAQQAVRAADQALAVAQQLEANNKKQVQIGTMANLDVVTAQAQVAASQRDLIVAQANVQNAELQLKTMLSRNLDEPLASASIETTDSFPEPDNEQLPVLAEAVEIANRNRPEISVAQGNMKSQQDVLPFLHNALLPNVNAFALLTTVGLYNVFGTSFSEALHFRYPQIAFGFTITFPLRNRQAQADEVRSRLELAQSQDTLVRTQSQIEVDVQNALIAVTQSKAQVSAARETVRLEEQKLDAEQEKLAAGLSTSYNVVLIQRDLLAAQLAEVQARDTYAKATVTLDQAMGVTLENSHLKLDNVLLGQDAPGQP